jgi:hypothetical protein
MKTVNEVLGQMSNKAAQVIATLYSPVFGTHFFIYPDRPINSKNGVLNTPDNSLRICQAIAKSHQEVGV